MGKIAVVLAVPGDLGRVRAIVQQGGHELVVVEHVAEADAADAMLTRYKVIPARPARMVPYHWLHTHWGRNRASGAGHATWNGSCAVSKVAACRRNGVVLW
jgi:hypothetical protein